MEKITPLLALAFYVLVWIKIDYDDRKWLKKHFSKPKEESWFDPQLSLFD